MAQAIVPILTQAGVTAAFNADLAGLQLELTHVALGSGQWTPDDTATVLVAEEERVPITNGAIIPPNQISVQALVDGPQEYWINEFGIIADGSILFAVWSSPTDPLVYKSANADTVFTHNVVLNAVPPSAVTVANITTDLNLTVVNELAQLATAIIGGQHREILDLQDRIALRADITALQAHH